VEQIDIKLTIREYTPNDLALSNEDRVLIQHARDAAKKAYAPYSNFSIGAAVLLDNGIIIQGNNQENAAYPSGLCAERVAIFYANAQYPFTPIVAVAIAGFNGSEYIDEPIPPCGSCRQVMLETQMRFKTPMRVILAGRTKIQALTGAETLLPLNFNKNMLT